MHALTKVGCVRAGASAEAARGSGGRVIVAVVVAPFPPSVLADHASGRSDACPKNPRCVPLYVFHWALLLHGSRRA
jgi:hypothetical protein